MAVSIVNLTSKANAANIGSDTVSIPPVGSLNILVIAFAGDFNAGSITSLTDSAGDTFVQAVDAFVAGATGSADIWYCLNPATGANSISWSASYSPGIWIYELSAGGLSFELADAQFSGIDPPHGVTACVGPSVSAPGDSSNFFLAVCGTKKNVTAVSVPWTLDALLAGATGGTQAAAHIVPAVGTEQATFTQDVAHGFIIVSATFKSAAPAGCGQATIADMITDLCKRAGLDASKIDVSLLADTAVQPVWNPSGYLIEHTTQAASALQEILKAFFIDACESDGKLKFVPRSKPIVLQSAYQQELEITALLITLPQPVTAGSILLAFHRADITTPTISDSAGNTWTQIYLTSGGSAAWYAVANATGTLTVSFDGGGTPMHTDGYVIEISCSLEYFDTAHNSGTSPPPANVTIGGKTYTTSFMFDATVWDMTAISLLPLGSTPGAVIVFLNIATGSGGGANPPAGFTSIFPGSSHAWSSVSIGYPPFTIPEIDLGLLQDGAEIVEQMAQEQDLPQSVTVAYNDATLDYMQGKQLKARNPRILTIGTKNQAMLSLPFSIVPDQARQIAEAMLYSAWNNRLSYTMNLWKALYLLLDPTDWVAFVFNGQTYLMRITGSNLGQAGAVALDGVSDDLRNYNSSVAGADSLGFVPRPNRQAAPTIMFLLDVPLLRDRDSNAGNSGFYVGLTSGSPDWQGAGLYESSDNANFTPGAAVKDPASFGYATTVLAAPRSPWDSDLTDSLTLAMSRGTLAGDTELNVLNGSNVLIVGSEVIQFETVAENTDGTYTVGRLLRGRRGTEWACGSHAINEPVIAPLDGGVVHQDEPIANVGKLRYYRGVTLGQDISSVPSQQLTLQGNDLKPYAPAGVGGTVDTSGNVIITWVRRTRIGGDWLDGTGIVPLSEGAELYDVDILDGTGAVKRTISNLTTPTAVYLATQIAADFGSLPPGGITVKVYQRSAQVGRGFAGTGIVPTPGNWPAPWPPVYPPSNGLYYVNMT